jgi:hypothetical protein
VEQIRLKVFDLYVNHDDRLKSQISFFQFWNDFLLNHMISEGVPIEETFRKIWGKLMSVQEQKELSRSD